MTGGESSFLFSITPDGRLDLEPPNPDTVSGKRYLKTPRNLHHYKLPLLESGLVDMDYLLPYMHGNPWNVPLPRTPGWEYHHVYHSKNFYKQNKSKNRNEDIATFRGISYNQMKLRMGHEDTYHLYHRIIVPWPPQETVEMALRDFRKIDELGAASLALAMTKGNTSLFEKLDKTDSPAAIASVPIPERIEFFEDMRRDKLREVEDLEVVPDRLVTSAIARMALNMHDRYLMEAATVRLEHDPVFYPVRPPSHRTLQIIGNSAASREFGVLAKAA